MNPIKPSLLLSPERRLIMTFALRQALEILQMPQQELALWIKGEAERNPLLELEAPSERSKFSLSQEAIQIASPETLFERLIRQTRENFSLLSDRLIAEKILGHLNEKGFLEASLEDIAGECKKSVAEIEAVLSVLQSFDPPGICARNLQESLLLQLKAQGKEKTPAYRLIQTCFEDLLHSRFSNIKKKLKIPNLSDTLELLARLHFRPAERFQNEVVPLAIPDFYLEKNEGKWVIGLDESEIPKIHLASQYLSVEPVSSEEKEALRLLKASAKWILRSLNRRKKLLLQIASILFRKQIAFLDQSGPLAPISLKEISQQLQIHESTLSRAVSGKFVQTPRGCISLRSLISSSPETQTAKELLEYLIGNEDKQNPWTDEQLARELGKNGFAVARRTIAKYRKQLKVGTALQRKNSGG